MSLVDFSQVKENSFEPVPAGKYLVISDSAEMKTTKSGGEMLMIKFKILEGPQEGRFLFENFNIKNANVKAVEIGLGQLKGFLKASKAPMDFTNWNDIVGYKAEAVTKIRHDDVYGDKAVISYFKEAPTSSGDLSATADLPF